jgi:solute carrier family 12 (sodium/potassium/chloride transporter), member 2
MSGDLKDPTSAIPKGTLLSIAITAVSYLGYAVLAAGCSLRAASGVLDEVLFAQGTLNSTIAEERNITRAFDDCDGRQCSYGLLYSQQMMEVMSAWGPLIYAGCFAATLSSAIGSLEGAPRVFQALAKDKLLPGVNAIIFFIFINLLYFQNSLSFVNKYPRISSAKYCTFG